MTPRPPAPARRRGIAALAAATLLLGAVCLADDEQNRRLLETLPRDRRASLAEDLARFDRLGGAERDAIRRLDKTLELAEPVEQARLRTLLHQYHLWFQGLPEDQRAALLAIPDLGERARAARKIRQAELAGPRREGPRIAGIRIGDYGMIGPYETAHLLKIWQALPPAERAEVAKLPPARLREALKARGRALKIRPEPFPPAQEKTYAAKLEADDEFRPLIEPMLRRAAQAVRKGEAQQADNAQRKYEHPYAEFLYFEENRPRPVPQALLERFAAGCPDWFRALTDSLSADAAREYYTAVYRLLYPTGEMPEPARVAPPAPKPASPRAAPGPNAAPL